jgi:putative transposase
MTLDFSLLGKLTNTTIVASFNGRFRTKCLNAHRFLSVTDDRAEIGVWRRAYNGQVFNESCPYTSLG